MMRLKPYLKNSVRPALLFSIAIATLVSLSGCLEQTEPTYTYKEENIPEAVKQVCKDEYDLDVTARRTPTTLWIYIPLSKILHKDYGIKEEKIFDEEMMGKLRNILTTIGRVVISSDKTPEFFALVASDIQLGLDYIFIGNVLDIKKSYAGFIPWTEANRRFVVRLKLVPEAVGDVTGEHLKAYDIKLSDFLAEQIAQRISIQFQEESLKKYFRIRDSRGRFLSDTFVFEYSIEQISNPEKEIDIKKEILNTITYCIKTYEFKDFSTVEIIDLFTQSKSVLNQAAIWAGPSK